MLFREEGEVPGDCLHRSAGIARVHLQTLWHTLARFGAPEGAGTACAEGVWVAG